MTIQKTVLVVFGAFLDVAIFAIGFSRWASTPIFHLKWGWGANEILLFGAAATVAAGVVSSLWSSALVLAIAAPVGVFIGAWQMEAPIQHGLYWWFIPRILFQLWWRELVAVPILATVGWLLGYRGRTILRRGHTATTHAA